MLEFPSEYTYANANIDPNSNKNYLNRNNSNNQKNTNNYSNSNQNNIKVNKCVLKTFRCKSFDNANNNQSIYISNQNSEKNDNPAIFISKSPTITIKTIGKPKKYRYKMNNNGYNTLKVRNNKFIDHSYNENNTFDDVNKRPNNLIFRTNNHQLTETKQLKSEESGYNN